MDVQMGKGNSRHLRNIRSFCLLDDFLSGNLLIIFYMDKVGTVEFRRFIYHLIRIHSFFWCQYPLLDQTEKTFGRRRHIIGCIMCIFKTYSEEFMVQFSQRGPFEFPTLPSRNGAEVSGKVLRIQRFPVQQVGRLLFTKKLSTRYLYIKIDVMADQIVGPGYILLEGLKHLFQVV